VRRALQNLSGRLLRGTTFAPVVQPILQSMFAQVVWRDSAGTEHGGAAVTYTVPGRSRTTLNLTMILDDMINSPEAGQFQSSGTNGRLSVRVRRCTTIDKLTEVLYHESMHMMSWIITLYGAAAVPGVERRAVRGLELSRFSSQIASIRRELDSLAQIVNTRHRASGRTQITADQLDQTARWLMEEGTGARRDGSISIGTAGRATAEGTTSSCLYSNAAVRLDKFQHYQPLCLRVQPHLHTGGSKRDDRRRTADTAHADRDPRRFFPASCTSAILSHCVHYNDPTCPASVLSRSIEPPSFIEHIGEATR
jgi:hypothetical protein